MTKPRSSTGNLWFAFGSVLVAVAVLFLAAKRYRATTSPLPQVDEPSVLYDAMNQARQEDKLVYAVFTAVWCGGCKVFEQETLNTAEGRAALKTVVPLEIDYDTHTDLAQRLNVEFIPTGLLMEVKGRTLRVVDGHVGGLSRSRFARFISRNVEKHNSARQRP